MNLLILTICFILYFNFSNNYICNHDKHIKQFPFSQKSIEKKSLLNYIQPTETNSKKIRITIDTSFLDPIITPEEKNYVCFPGVTQVKLSGSIMNCKYQDILTDEKKNYLVNLAKQSALRFKDTFSVIPAGSIKLSINSCWLLPIPKKYKDGVSDSDLIIFISARPIGNGVVAFSNYCYLDEFDRPLVGFINSDPFQLIPNDDYYIQQLYSIMHEMTHVLGFSQDFWTNHFKNSSGQNYNTHLIEKVIGAKNQEYMITKINSPRVVSQVRKHFNCQSLNGAEIENGGDSGTAGSHWEKRIFFEEYMIGTSYRNPVISNITLSYFHDSGHYFPNYSMGEKLYFGNSFGCDFIKPGKCVENWPSFPEGYNCDQNNQNAIGCSPDMKLKVNCDNSFETVSNLPSQYQYYSDPTKAGRDMLMDYCPISVWQTSCFYQSERDRLDFYGEIYSMESRCFISTLIKNNVIGTQIYAGCYQMICISSNELRIKIDGFYYQCPFGAESYGGLIVCPLNNLICSDIINSTKWPYIFNTFPNSVYLGDTIQITGLGFDVSSEVLINGILLENVIINDSLIIGSIPTSKLFPSLKWLNGHFLASVFVKDSMGKSIVKFEIINVNFSINQYFKHLGMLMKENPFELYDISGLPTSLQKIIFTKKYRSEYPCLIYESYEIETYPQPHDEYDVEEEERFYIDYGNNLIYEFVIRSLETTYNYSKSYYGPYLVESEFKDELQKVKSPTPKTSSKCQDPIFYAIPGFNNTKLTRTTSCENLINNWDFSNCDSKLHFGFKSHKNKENIEKIEYDIQDGYKSN